MSKDTFTGTWRLDVPASNVPFSPPRSVVVRIDVDETSICMTEDSVAADGTVETVRLRAQFDGETYPVSGSHRVDSFAVTRVDSHTLRTRAAKAGGSVFYATLVLAPDGSKLSEEVETRLPDDTRTTGTLVFRRAT